MSKKIPVIYSYLQVRLEDKTNGNRYLKLSEAKSVLGNYRIPKVIHFHILKDMEYYDLIKIHNKIKGIEIKKNNYVIEKNESRVILRFDPI